MNDWIDRIHKDVEADLLKIWNGWNKFNLDKAIFTDIVFLMCYMQKRPRASRKLLAPVIASIDAGIDPMAVAYPILCYLEVEEGFAKKAKASYKGKMRKSKNKHYNIDEKKYKRVYEAYQQELKMKQKKLPYKKLENLLQEVFKEELKKSPGRLDSIKVQYYRFKKKWENPSFGITEDAFIRKAIEYCFTHQFESDPIIKNGKEVVLVFSHKLGRSRSFYDEVMNAEKREEQNLRYWQKRAKQTEKSSE